MAESQNPTPVLLGTRRSCNSPERLLYWPSDTWERGKLVPYEVSQEFLLGGRRRAINCANMNQILGYLLCKN